MAQAQAAATRLPLTLLLLGWQTPSARRRAPRRRLLAGAAGLMAACRAAINSLLCVGGAVSQLAHVGGAHQAGQGGKC